jgi:SAM-dependent methyltransferase
MYICARFEVISDPSLNMVRRAASRGIQVCAAYGERLPFPHHTFDFVVLVIVGCFIEDLHVLFGEARRILRPNGRIIHHWPY